MRRDAYSFTEAFVYIGSITQSGMSILYTIDIGTETNWSRPCSLPHFCIDSHGTRLRRRAFAIIVPCSLNGYRHSKWRADWYASRVRATHFCMWLRWTGTGACTWYIQVRWVSCPLVIIAKLPRGVSTADQSSSGWSAGCFLGAKSDGT